MFTPDFLKLCNSCASLPPASQEVREEHLGQQAEEGKEEMPSKSPVPWHFRLTILGSGSWEAIHWPTL